MSEFPQVSPGARLSPRDFDEVLWHLRPGCVLVGGQAVAFWSERYRASGLQTVTSEDIDFWGSREDLVNLAKAMKRQPICPHQYEMTVWIGAMPLEVAGQRTLVEFLHTVPGLDTNNPENASVDQEMQVRGQPRRIRVLTPVSLIIAKIHNLRHFDQTGRADEFHLKTCLAGLRPFFDELMQAKEFRLVFWNVRRLVDCAQMRPNQKIAAQYGFDILSAVPVDAICAQAERDDLSAAERDSIRRFCNEYWPRVKERLKQP